MSIQTQPLRAVIWPLLSPEAGLLSVDRFAWAALEKAEGQYDFEPVRVALERAWSIRRCAILRVEPLVPAFCTNAAEGYARLMTALGVAFGGEPAILGVDVCYPGDERLAGECELTEMVRVFEAAFPRAVLFAPASGRLLGRIEVNAGAVVTPDNVACVEAEWPRMPLRMAVDPADAGAIAFAAAHHISILECGTPCNAPAPAGHRFVIRSVTLDDEAKETGAVKVSVTVANAGTAPCYRPAGFMLRLSGSDVADGREYPLPLCAAEVGPGCERTAELEADVSGLEKGEYHIEVGLFLEGSGYPVPFGIEGRISDGYYEGRLMLTIEEDKQG